jgi:uncharacterized membrane protein (UPF0127 family)
MITRLAQAHRDQRLLAERLEFFRSAAERARGLLKYSQAPRQSAAVFDLALGGFLPVVHTFGMKFSIDIVFCNSEKVVRAIYRAVKPGRLIAPGRYLLGGCSYLVEFSLCDLGDLRVGDRLEW